MSSLSSKKPISGDGLYELRTYHIYPNKMRDYLGIVQKEFHLRTAQSNLFGFWICELGGLNQVIHLWPYDDLDHRSKVRGNLAKDEKWNENFVHHAMPCIQSQDNALLRSLPNQDLKISKNCAFYEMVEYSIIGPSSIWEELLQSFLALKNKDLQNETSSSFIGAFKTLVGSLNSAVLFWQHPTYNSFLENSQINSECQEYKNFVKLSRATTSKLLSPFAQNLWMN